MSHRRQAHVVCVLGFGIDGWLSWVSFFLLFDLLFSTHTLHLSPGFGSLHLGNAARNDKTCLVRIFLSHVLYLGAGRRPACGGLANYLEVDVALGCTKLFFVFVSIPLISFLTILSLLLL